MTDIKLLCITISIGFLLCILWLAEAVDSCAVTVMLWADRRVCNLNRLFERVRRG